jgi:hypothetical protein
MVLKVRGFCHVQNNKTQQTFNPSLEPPVKRKKLLSTSFQLKSSDGLYARLQSEHVEPQDIWTFGQTILFLMTTN